MTSVLPARPDLEHLRQEAKYLLRQLRVQEPAALVRLVTHAPGLIVTLGTAQLIIAREHGFASWAQLKAAEADMWLLRDYIPEASSVIAASSRGSPSWSAN